MRTGQRAGASTSGRRRVAVLSCAALIYAAALLTLLQTPSGYALLVPGPAVDTLDMLQPWPGPAADDAHLFATTVGTIPRVSVLNLIRAAFVPAASPVPAGRLLHEGQSVAQFLADGRRAMEQSKVAAEMAALRYMGADALFRGSGAQVISISDPVISNIFVGDIIVRLDGSRVSTDADLHRRVRQRAPGQLVRVSLLRHGDTVTVEVHLRAGAGGGATLGIGAITAHPRLATGHLVTLDAGNVIGPSAGLMMSLAVLDRLSGHRLAKGHAIAGTGTISVTGEVGPVGGLAQKVAGAEMVGAEYFLVPRGNYAEAARAARKLKIIPVASLAEAVAFLESLPQELSAIERRPPIAAS